MKSEMDFQLEVAKLSGVFEMPKGYEVVQPVENGDMGYEFAVRHPTVNYEIRYALRPIPKEMSEKKPARISADPEAMAGPEFQVIMLNIAGSGSAKDPTSFDPQAAKTEFGADSGLTTRVQNMTSQFAGKFKNCMMIGIHKKGVGQLYIFHLFDIYDNQMDKLTQETFHSLRFKSAGK
jgi:hypothetical protein